MHHDEDDLDATVIRPRGRRGGPLASGEQVGPGGQVGSARPVRLDEVDDPFGDTVLRDPVLRDAGIADPVLGDPVAGDLLLGDTERRGRRRRSPAHRALVEPPVGPGSSEAAPVIPPAPVVRPDHVPSIRVGGRVVRLDRPVVVGRRPGLPRVVRGPTPELLTVPSPTGQVSGSHLLLHAAGETAVVDDLHSTNGTVIRPPGGTPHRMASGTSNVVLTGTVVEIGDGNTIEILSPFTRLTPPGSVPPGPSRTPRERS